MFSALQITVDKAVAEFLEYCIGVSLLLKQRVVNYGLFIVLCKGLCGHEAA